MLFGAELVEPEPPEDELPPDVDETGGPLSDPPQAANVSPTAAIAVKSAIFMESLRDTQWPAAVPVEVGRPEAASRTVFGAPGSGAARYGNVGR